MVVVFHVMFNMLVVVFNFSTVFHAIVVSHVFSNVLVVMNVTAVGMAAFVVAHVMSNVLMVVLNVTAVLHAMDMAMLFGVGVLYMMQLGFAVMLSTAAMERVAVMGNFIVVFHGLLLN